MVPFVCCFMLVVGVDPGALGAAIAYDGGDYCSILKLKEGRRALNSFMLDHVDADYCSIENIIPRSGWRVNAICSLYGSFASCQQAAALLKCPTELTTPREWQSTFGLYGMKAPSGLTEAKKSVWKKNKHKDKLVEILKGRPPFPTPTHVITDAALITIRKLIVMGNW